MSLFVCNATTVNDFYLAGRLIYEQYVEANISTTSACGVRLSRYQLLPSSTVFLAFLDSSLIYTATVIPYSEENSLPTLLDFPTTAEELLKEDNNIAEVAHLAGRFVSLKYFTEFCGYLFNFMKNKFNSCILTCHPKHSKYYIDVWNGKMLEYKEVLPRVNNLPGCFIQIILDDTKVSPFAKRIIEKVPVLDNLSPVDLSHSDRAFLETFVI